RDLGVLVEQFVEVAHPKQQQRPRGLGLDLLVPLHHRCQLGVSSGGHGAAARRSTVKRGESSGSSPVNCWIVAELERVLTIVPSRNCQQFPATTKTNADQARRRCHRLIFGSPNPSEAGVSSLPPDSPEFETSRRRLKVQASHDFRCRKRPLLPEPL